jgi:prolyl-tRNA editing enzyme YbaK/EbsC (Cys-tRNA(Pro) deacylase)
MLTLLDEKVAGTIAKHSLAVEEVACDPDFADTAAFNEKYGFKPEQGANTILVVSKKVEPAKYAVCVVLASTRLDVNKKVTELLGVKKASFADGETTKQLTGMQIGGVVAVGAPEGLPIFIDAAVIGQPKIIMGGGNRTSKILLDPQELLKLPGAQVVENLAKPVEP